MANHLNEAILAAVRSLPEGRGYRFEPRPRLGPTDPSNPRDPNHDGVTRDLFWKGKKVARAADDGATYCCGVTFEAWLEAVGDGNLRYDPSGMQQLLAEWFCPIMGHGGVATALTGRRLGDRVNPDDAQPGDLCQFWRSTDLASPSGHSVVFLGWEENNGTRRMRYWSSQQATEGIGEHVEEVGPDWELHFVRAKMPIRW
jgi:hypothetical protein